MLRFPTLPRAALLLALLSVAAQPSASAQTHEGAFGLAPSPGPGPDANAYVPPAPQPSLPPSYQDTPPYPPPVLPPQPQYVPGYPPQPQYVPGLTPPGFGFVGGPPSAESVQRLRLLALRERVFLFASGAGILLAGVGSARLFASDCLYTGDECRAGLTLISLGVSSFVVGTLGGGVVAIRASRQLASMGLAPRRGLAIFTLVAALSMYGTAYAPIPLAVHARHVRRQLALAEGLTPPGSFTLAIGPFADRERGAVGLALAGTF